MHKKLSRGNGKQHFPFPRDVFCRVEKRFSFIYILSMSESSNNEIVIYTDGGCSGNPGPGGWANVILADGTENPHSGGEHLTTNNRMELMAVIQALTEISTNPQWSAKSITVCTDSQYVKNGITTWIKNWKKNNWKTASKQPVKNQDLWTILDSLASKLNIQWNWVKGHAGIKYNEICDSLCQEQIKKFS